MKFTHAVQVQIEVRGDVPRAAAELAVAKVRSLLRMAPEPVLFARVTLAMAADPAVERPATVRANLDLNGRLILAQAAAVTAHEAVERMSDRLRVRLERAARTWAATRGGKPVALPHEWRHESVPGPRLPYFPRVPEERTIVRRTSYALARQTPEEAAADLELLGYDFHLFTEEATGEDSVIYRTAGGYRMTRAHQGTARPVPADASITVSERPVPGLSPGAAAARLEALGQPFVFFVDIQTGHGSLIYHRYDGHYGLITPVDAESPTRAAPRT